MVSSIAKQRKDIKKEGGKEERKKARAEVVKANKDARAAKKEKKRKYYEDHAGLVKERIKTLKDDYSAADEGQSNRIRRMLELFGQTSRRTIANAILRTHASKKAFPAIRLKNKEGKIASFYI